MNGRWTTGRSPAWPIVVGTSFGAAPRRVPGSKRPSGLSHVRSWRNSLMSPFPSAVTDYLKRVALDHRAPAFLLAGGDGMLLSSGGDLAHYGLGELITGEPVLEQAFFLT